MFQPDTIHRIGALRETPPGTFTVKYFDPCFTAYPEERAAAFSRMMGRSRGPYESISEFYACISQLNISQGGQRAADEYGPEALADCETLAEMASQIVVPEFENGPFVIGHNNLTMQNILVLCPMRCLFV